MSRFINRKDAGNQLAKKLTEYRGKDAVILALPRGGVVIGYEIARTLNLPLDIVVVRKIGHPDNSEYAICAVDEKGSLLCDEAKVGPVNRHWLNEEILRQKKEALRRIKLYRGEKKPTELNGKTVIIVDDGIATGLTIRAAVRIVRKENPSGLVIAVPIAPREVTEELSEEGRIPVVTLDDGQDYLGAVGAYYDDFPQVSDGEVVELLS